MFAGIGFCRSVVSGCLLALILKGEGSACGSLLCTETGTGLLDHAPAFLMAAGTFIDEHGGREAKDGDGCCQYPGTFFQYVRSLAYTHYLIAETAEGAGETAAFGVLHQHKETE